MSNGNAQLIQSLYDAFARGDAETVLGAFDAQIVWMEAENSPYADRNPYLGPQRVAEEVFTRLLTEWEGFTIVRERTVAEEDTVITMGRYHATHRATGRRLDAQFVHAWTVRDGRVTAFQQYTDSAQWQRVVQAEMAQPLA